MADEESPRTAATWRRTTSHRKSYGTSQCGNTRPEARRLVIGLRARGVAGTNFNPSTGLGHVAAQDGHYARAEAHGVRPLPALFETFGGFGDGAVAFVTGSKGSTGRQNPS